MKHLKMFGLAALAAVLMALVAGTASATTIEKEAGKPLPSGTAITAEAQTSIALHPPIGEIICAKSHIGGKTINAGGAGVNVNANVEALSFSKCNTPVVTVVQNGSLSIAHSGGSNGTLRSTGAEITVEFAGFHCIFRTSNTSLGTITGGTNATLDISGNIPRTGGTHGVFCGSTAAITGSYKVTTPSPLRITG